MTKWPKDNQTARNAFYGDPGRGEIASQMVPVVPPFRMTYTDERGTKVIKAIQFHRKAAPALLAALNEIWDACGRDQVRIDAAGVSKYAGAYNHRMVRGSKTKWSNHAYAAAIDLNAAENGLYAKGNMPQFVIDAFCRQGWMWGGWYSGRKDPMHFEAVDNGGRKPKSPPPVFGAKPLTLTPDVPADEFEDQPAHPPALDPVVVDAEVVGDPEMFWVQKRLKAMNYNPGVIDGRWGGGMSGALSGFINDRGGKIVVPASIDAFTDTREEIKAELSRAESENPPFTRPVSAARKSGDAAMVAKVAPEVVPVKQNFWLALWGSIVTFFTAVWTQISEYVSQAWDWYTDNSDSGIISTISGWVSQVPTVVWILAGAAALAWIAINSRVGVNKITESVQSGERL